MAMLRKKHFDKYIYLFLLPGLIYLFCIRVAPLIYTGVISLYSWNLAHGDAKYVGITNYIDLFWDHRFRSSIIRTFIFTGGAVGTEILLGLGVALLLRGEVSQPAKLGKRFIGIVILPMSLAPVVVGVVWRLIYHSEYGLINAMLGIKGFRWISSPKMALFSIIVADVWEWTPFVVLVLFAALQNAPLVQYEAARIDGASKWKAFLHITLPFLSPALFLVGVLRFIEAFIEFPKMFVMTGGGPARATEVASIYIYKQAFTYFNVGIAGASVMTILPIVLISALFMFFVSHRKAY